MNISIPYFAVFLSVYLFCLLFSGHFLVVIFLYLFLCCGIRPWCLVNIDCACCSTPSNFLVKTDSSRYSVTKSLRWYGRPCNTHNNENGTKIWLQPRLHKFSKLVTMAPLQLQQCNSKIFPKNLKVKRVQGSNSRPTDG